EPHTPHTGVERGGWKRNAKGVPDTRQMREGEGEKRRKYIVTLFSLSSSPPPDISPPEARRLGLSLGHCRVPPSAHCRVSLVARSRARRGEDGIPLLALVAMEHALPGETFENGLTLLRLR